MDVFPEKVIRLLESKVQGILALLNVRFYIAKANLQVNALVDLNVFFTKSCYLEAVVNDLSKKTHVDTV